MSVETAIQTLTNTDRKLVIKLDGSSSGSSDLAKTTIVDVSGFTDGAGNTCKFVSLERVWSSVHGGIRVSLFWDSSTDYNLLALGNKASSAGLGTYNLDFTAGGWGGLKPPTLTTSTIVLSDSSMGAGTPTGDILANTTGAATGDHFNIVLEMRKHY